MYKREGSPLFCYTLPATTVKRHSNEKSQVHRSKPSRHMRTIACKRHNINKACENNSVPTTHSDHTNVFLSSNVHYNPIQTKKRLLKPKTRSLLQFTIHRYRPFVFDRPSIGLTPLHIEPVSKPVSYHSCCRLVRYTFYSWWPKRSP